MKKLTSILILMSIILSLFSFPVSAAETTTASGGAYAEDYGVLDALGVINADTWSDGTVTTRAEFIQLCVNLTKCEDIKAMETYPVFTDITAGHWAYDAIMYAYKMGYVSAYADGSIKPDSPITYGEAMQIMVNFLGYQIVAASYNNGDIEGAYYQAAFGIGLLEGVVADGLDRPLLKSSSVRMAFNALEIELPVQYFSNNNVFFNVQNDRTLLRVKFNTYRAKGVVRADDYISLSHNLAKENYVTIDGENYFSAYLDVNGLIGCTALYYYRQASEEEEKELLYISPVETEITVVPAEELDGYSNMKINTTTATGKKVSYKIAKDTTVIWNNKIITSAEYADKFKVKSGSAKLIDNDSDGDIEVVIIESLTNGVVTVNNTKDMSLKLNDGTVYNLEDYKNYRIENRYGELIDMLAIHVEDVVSVIDPESENHTLVIQICKKNDVQIVGSVDDDGYVLIGDGSELKYSYTAASDYEELIVGDSYIFYTDKYGEIVYATHVRANDYEVVYLVNYKQQPGMDSNLALRVMHADGTITNMDGARNIKIRDKNGEYSVKKADSVITMLNQGGTTPLRQAVMLRTNALGEVNEIMMLANPERIDLQFHQIPYTQVGGSGLRWYMTPRSLSNAIQITLGTPLFAVPHTTKTSVDDEEFFVTNYTIFETGVYYKETGDTGFFATPIGLDKGDFVADYMIWEYPENVSDRTKHAKTSYTGIVTKISQIVDENGEEFTKVTFCTEGGIFGNTVLYKATDGSLTFKGRKSFGTDDLSTMQIGVGDIIEISIDDYVGHATELNTTVYYDASENMVYNVGTSSSPAFYAWRLEKGVITRKKDGFVEVLISRPDGTTLTQILDLASAISIKCDYRNNMFTKDRSPDSLLAVDDSFFMIISGGVPKALLIYE